MFPDADHHPTALAGLVADGALNSVAVEGDTLWFDQQVAAEAGPARPDAPAAMVLSTFDEAALSYPRHPFPRIAPTAERTRLVSEAGGGIVVVDGPDGWLDVGTFKRVVGADAVAVRVRLEAPVSTGQADAISQAVHRLGDFLRLPARCHLQDA